MSFNQRNLSPFDIDHQDRVNRINARSGAGYDNQSDDVFARHHQSQSTGAHCSSAMDPNQSSIEMPDIKNANIQPIHQQMIDQQLPKMTNESNISLDSVNITSYKTNGVRAADADFKPTSKNGDADTSHNKRKKMKDDKKSQSMVRQRKRKSANTKLVAVDSKKKQIFNETMDTADKMKRFKLALCAFSTAQKWDQAKHVRKHTKKQQPYQCEFCRVQFTQQHNLFVHMKKHGEMFAFQCSICRRGFALENQWNMHKSLCKSRQYECHLCNRKFYQRRSDLSRHMRIWHTGEKPFRCSECPKRFNVKSSLGIHMRQHVFAKVVTYNIKS